MKVDAYIVKAIDQYILDNNMTQRELAKKVGIGPATMVKWRRQGNGIADRHWISLFKLIRNYLPSERIYIAGDSEEHYSSVTEGTKEKAYFKPKYIPVMVPVLMDENLLEYHQMLQSVEQYVAGRNFPRVEYRPHIKINGVFCYILPKSAVGVPKGARLFISSDEKPRNGGLVLAVTSENKIILAKYTTNGNSFTIAGNKETITGKLSQARQMLTMLATVIMYEVYTI